MTSIPSGAGRVPTRWASQSTLTNLTNTNLELLRVQQQMATNKRVLRPSDDPIAAAGIATLDREIERDAQIRSNLRRAEGVMNTADQALGSLVDVINQAKVVASEQVGITSDSTTRRQQAAIVSAMIDEVFATVNREYAGISVFAGAATGSPAVEAFGAGYRYAGDNDGLRTDLGPGIDFPITVSGDAAIGATSARQEGTADLDPAITARTRVSDLRGPVTGQQLGVMNANVTPPGVDVQIDLSDAETVGDLRDRIASEIEQAAPGALVGGFAGGVGVAGTGDRLQINVAAGTTVTFDDGPIGQTATALGLSGVNYTNVVNTNPAAAADLDPRVTSSTLLSDLQLPLAIAPGDVIRIENGPNSADLAMDPTWSIDRLRDEVDRLNLGVRVEIDDSGNSINFVNEVSGYRMSIGEAPGTIGATKLGVRSMQGDTSIGLFNDGRGVEIADGSPDPTKNTDFEVVLSDGFTFVVDLVPTDMTDATSVITAINNAALGAGLAIGTGPGQFQARLAEDGNGIALQDFRGGPDATQVNTLNGFAAEDLGFLDPRSATTAGIVGSDRSNVRVDSLFTALIDLEQALAGDDPRAITRAAEWLEGQLENVTSARGLLGGRTQRVEDADNRLAERAVLNETIRVDLEDLDFYEATTRFSALELQLEASLAVTSRLASLSLVNFL